MNTLPLMFNPKINNDQLITFLVIGNSYFLWSDCLVEAKIPSLVIVLSKDGICRLQSIYLILVLF